MATSLLICKNYYSIDLQLFFSSRINKIVIALWLNPLKFLRLLRIFNLLKFRSRNNTTDVKKGQY